MMATFDYAAAAQRLQARAEARDRALAERLRHARQEADAVVAMIIRKYAPQRVWQWGSLVHGQGFSEASDLDIAIEGVTDPKRFFALAADAETLTGLPVDLVQMEMIDPAHAESIRRKGRLVYDAAAS